MVHHYLKLHLFSQGYILFLINNVKSENLKELPWPQISRGIKSCWAELFYRVVGNSFIYQTVD